MTSWPGMHAALCTATRVPAVTLAGMTLACYQGTGLAEVTARPACRGTRSGRGCQAMFSVSVVASLGMFTLVAGRAAT